LQTQSKQQKVRHLCGILSDGGVHSHVDHMIETAKILENLGLKVIYIFLGMDVM
jgi:2,3-bisphosphoglycerate-independent phosphoglycerate mutase